MHSWVYIGHHLLETEAALRKAEGSICNVHKYLEGSLRLRSSTEYPLGSVTTPAMGFQKGFPTKNGFPFVEYTLNPNSTWLPP